MSYCLYWRAWGCIRVICCEIHLVAGQDPRKNSWKIAQCQMWSLFHCSEHWDTILVVGKFIARGIAPIPVIILSNLMHNLAHHLPNILPPSKSLCLIGIWECLYISCYVINYFGHSKYDALWKQSIVAFMKYKTTFIYCGTVITFS